jgi:DNA-binding XRE family transcriptional regulator
MGERAFSRSILKVSFQMTKKSIRKVSIRQIKAARALLAWSQEQLAESADVSLPTIKRLEANDGPLGGRSNTGAKIQSTLESGGVEFIDENGGGAGVRLRKPSRKKS